MTKRKVTDVAASVRARLLASAKESGKPFQEVLQYFVMERFLHRLSKSSYVERLVLKGGLMLSAWKAPLSRPTKDMDFLAHMSNEPDSIAAVVREICDTPDNADGLHYDTSNLQAVAIKEDADYPGVRVTFLAYLQQAKIHMQIDVGFGDVVIPRPVKISYPTILGHEAPEIRGYPREATVAEKYEAMVKLGQLNSRIRDFFDVWLLSRQFDFDGQLLSHAMRETFANRGTEIDTDPVALKPEFSTDSVKQSQWRGFCRKSRIGIAPASLQEVCDAISEFLLPVATSLRAGQEFEQTWIPSGPWKEA